MTLNPFIFVVVVCAMSAFRRGIFVRVFVYVLDRRMMRSMFSLLYNTTLSLIL